MFSYFLFILGCQFNYYDAEKIALALDGIGGMEVVNVKDADVAIIFACSVRQKAADRILGHIRNWKKGNSSLKVIATACVLPADTKRISNKADLAIKTEELLRKSDEVINSLLCHTEQSEVSISRETFATHSRAFECRPVTFVNDRKSNYQLYNPKSAYVTITAGCNNFCTYCAVPLTRGRETSKPAPMILAEITELTKRRIDHIILLGQNVNSYGLSDFHPRDMRKNKSPKGTLWSVKNPSPFTRLLRQIDDICGIKMISFLSPNPQDMSSDLIDWIKNSPKFSRNLNLPMQSGSTRILKKMNRRYSRAKYLTLVRTLRSAVPDIFLSTDIIVGFPGETEKDFQKTVDAVKKCRFDKAFISIYSPRPGTASALMADNVNYAEKKRRWEYLNKLINR